jgi:hypothetical protein
MSRGRQIARYGGGLLALWVVALVVGGLVGGGVVRDRVATRLADSLRAEVTIRDARLALIRGRVELSGMAIRRTDVGTLRLDIAAIRCELLPLGGALIDRECRDLVVEGVRLEASAAAVFQIPRPKRTPLRARHVEITDAQLEFAPSAFVPGLGRIAIRLEHVTAGPTTFKTPMSWMFAMTELRARLELPAGVVVVLTYANGMLTASGALFGSSPVILPFALPVAAAADDARAEIATLIAAWREVAQALVARKAQDWLRSKLPL